MTVWLTWDYCESVIKEVTITKHLEINKQSYVIIVTGKMKPPFKWGIKALNVEGTSHRCSSTLKPIDQHSQMQKRSGNCIQELFKIKKGREKGNSRWWHRKILSLPPSTDTPNLQLHIDHFPLKSIWKVDKLLSTTKDKRTTFSWVGEAEIQIHKKSHPLHNDTQ